MPSDQDNSAQDAATNFISRQITGLDVRLVAAEQALLGQIGRTDNFLKRNAEIVCLVTFIGGYIFRLLTKG